jgi:WD40 repeat protein
VREEIDRKRSYRVVRPEIARMKEEGSVTILATSTDFRYVVTARADEVARLWDASRAQPTNYKQVDLAAFSPDDALLATAAIRGEYVRVWESATGREVAQLKTSGELRTLLFNRDGRFLLGAGSRGALLWDLGREQPLITIAPARSASFDPSGRFLVAVETNKAMVWDLRAGRALAPLACSCRMGDVVFSPGGKYFVITGNDGTVRIRALDPAGTSRDLTQVNASDITFSPDEGLLVISEDEVDLTAGGTPAPTGAGRVRIWDMRSGREIVTIKQSTSVGSVIVSPDGRYIAGGGRVWESRTGREVTRVEGHIVAFSPDMSYLVTHDSKLTRIWIWRPDDLIAVACKQVSRNLTQEEWRRYLGNEPYRKTCDHVPALGRP